MTTTPNPTAEQIVAEELYEEYNFKSDADALEAARVAVSALRAAGLLVGDPSEEQIEAVARELACLDEGDPWPTNAQLGGSLTGDRDMEYRSGMREQARDLLLAAARAAGVAPQEPSAHVNPVATSGERVKNQADSFNVAQQEPSEPTYSPTTGQWSSYCPCIRVEQVDPECEWHGRPEFRRWLRGGGR